MTIIGEITRAGMAWVIDRATIAIRQMPKPPETPPPHTESKCISCTAHAEVGLAYVYLLGLAERCEDGKPIPNGLGGTLELARQHVGNAISQIPDIGSINPDTAKLSIELAEQLPDIERRLTNVTNGLEAKALRDDLKRALDTAYRIPEAVYCRGDKDEYVLVPKKEITEIREAASSLKQEIARLEEDHAVGH